MGVIMDDIICPKCNGRMKDKFKEDRLVCSKCNFNIDKNDISQAGEVQKFYFTNSMEVDIKDEKNNNTKNNESI